MEKTEKTASIYVHIPFCKSKCVYCDFASFPNLDHLMAPYVSALLTEIQNSHPMRVNTVYIGGGTPSHLPAEMMEKILAALHAKFTIAPDAELTIEANPRSATAETLKRYRAMGLNRLSIGVQSFNDKMLNTLGRAHTAKEALETVQSARLAGFDNLSLDLIYGVPGQTPDDFNNDLATAISASPDHISAYQLTVEEDTVLWDMVESGKVTMPDDDLQLAMYEAAILRLGAGGYRHYEVSNFCRPGRECLHNLAYWVGDEFLGFGSGAHSFLDGFRFANPDDPESYVYEIDTAGKAGVEIHADENEKIIDYLLMRLRLVNRELTFEDFRKKFKKDFAADYAKQITVLEKQGFITASPNSITLTHKGLLFLDDVLLIFENV